jgi:hypothetical protein
LINKTQTRYQDLAGKEWLFDVLPSEGREANRITEWVWRNESGRIIKREFYTLDFETDDEHDYEYVEVKMSQATAKRIIKEIKKIGCETEYVHRENSSNFKFRVFGVENELP